MKIISTLTISLLLIISSCKLKPSSPIDNKEDVKTILIHCGVTMIQPVTELAKIIEEQENCKILITQGGSGNLYRSITTNKMGDLYLPGSEKYIKTGIEEGYITDKVLVGENKAAIMVQKGNPKNIPATIESLLDTSYRIVIGNPNSGSIGKETKDVLSKIGIYEDIRHRAVYQTIDSRDLIRALKEEEADIIINWFATSTWENNKDFVDVLECDKQVIKKNQLFIGQLVFSQYPDIAKKFMQLASSAQGQETLKKYGLAFDEEQ